jgi:hypothetical protein
MARTRKASPPPASPPTASSADCRWQQWTPPGAVVTATVDDGMIVLAVTLASGEVLRLGVHPLVGDWSAPWLLLCCRAHGAWMRARAAEPFDLSEPAKGDR